MTKTIPKRDEVNIQDKWNIEELYANDEEWFKDYNRLKEEIPSIRKYKGKLGQSPKTLSECLKEEENIRRLADKIVVYAHLKNDEDTTNNYYSGRFDMASNLYSQMNSEFSFIKPEIINIEQDKLEEFLQHKELKPYSFKIKEIIRLKPHMLSHEEEKLMALASDPLSGSSKIFTVLNNGDIKFPIIIDEDGNEIQITHARYSNLIRSQDREVRKEAFEKYMNVYKEFKNSFSTTLSTHIKSSIFNSKVRKYNSSIEHYLNYDNVDTEIYDNLLNSVNNNLKALHKYVSLRKKVLGVDQLHVYDLYTNLVKNFDKKYTFDEAKDMMIESLFPLGKDYTGIVKKAIKDGWIDKYENLGKRSGAYSSGSYDSFPYILLNFNGSINSVFTLAHEMGHSVHTYYSKTNQPYTYADYKIFVAEVASLTNEALLNHYLLNKVDSNEEKLFLINQELEKIRGTLFRQCLFAEFEKRVYEEAEAGKPLTADYMSELYRDLNRRWYGDDIIIDEPINYEWARIPHFYYNFYVYKYCIGISCANTLAEKIINGESGAVDKYINKFLKAGGSDYPVEILKSAGVDISSPEPIERTISYFTSLVDDFDRMST